MQKLIFLFVSLICLMASCTADDIIGRTDTVDTLRADGYLRMCISMPSARDSRAANDEYENGLPAEYAIHSAFLFLFEGDTDDELKAKFHSAYDISAVTTDVNPDGNQITTASTRVVRCLDNGKNGFRKKKHFALVFFNAEDFVTNVNKDHLSVTVAGQEIKSVQVPSASAQHVTLEQFLQIEKKMTDPDALNPFTSRTKGFFMCSAPLLDKPGGSSSNQTGLASGRVHYTCPVSDRIYDTEREAQANPAVACYVERGVAKVTMQKTLKNDQLSIPDLEIVTVDDEGHLISSSAKPKCKLVGWMLDNTNMRSFLVRNYDTRWNTLQTKSSTTSKPFRFVGETPVTAESGLYRTYWAKDPNYSTDGATHANDLNQFYTSPENPLASDNPRPSASDPFPMGFGYNFPQYCFENTYDVANQMQDRTTRIIAKIQIDNGQTEKDFYVVNNDISQLYTAKALQAKYHVDEQIKEAIANHPDIKKAYEVAIKNKYPGEDLSKHPLVPGNCYYKQEVTADGLYRITSVWVNLAEGNVVNGHLDELTPATWDEELGFNLNIRKFTGGFAYYPIRIKHFGDNLTPWDKDEYGAVRPSPSTIYPGNDDERANNYLGRYGVVRNNWYDISIRSIRSLGSPVIPKPTAIADDELDNYIQVEINILKWTLRPQGADL